MVYRPDIDGLRAYAVLSIMVLHLGLPYFPGAFYMLDIFFVISGYLITGQILMELGAGKFSLARFYERRVRRILPAAIVTLLAAMLAAIFIFPVVDRTDNVWLVLSALYSSSNILMGLHPELEQGVKLMRHAWSLGVEEQFYLVFPLTLALVFPFLARKSWMVLAAIGVISFLWALRETAVYDPQDYYWTHLRVWEFMIGALLAYLPRITIPRITADVLGLGALLVMTFCLVFLDVDRFKTPGPLALLPTLATAAFVIAGQQRCASTILMSNRPMILVGKMSYSLYLWHLLIFDTFRILANGGNNVGHKNGIMLYTIALGVAWLSWTYVEKPFRGGGSTITGRALAFWIIGGFAVITVIGVGALLRV